MYYDLMVIHSLLESEYIIRAQKLDFLKVFLSYMFEWNGLDIHSKTIVIVFMRVFFEKNVPIFKIRSVGFLRKQTQDEI